MNIDTYGWLCIIVLVALGVRKVILDVTGVIRFWYTDTGQALKLIGIIALIVGVICFLV